MRNTLRQATTLWLALAILTPLGVQAKTRDALRSDVIEWAGTGEAEAYVVVDFDQITTLSREFVFGVRFTTGTTITGQTALDMLTSETAFSYVAPGGFLDSMSYDYKGTVHTRGGPYPKWWTYWGSNDYGTSWTAHSVGIDSRVMADGDTDGWMHFRDGFPVTAVPNGPRTTPRVALEEDVIEWVGTGPYTAYVVVDFSQSATSWAEFVFATRFTSPTLTGRQLLDLVADNTALSYDAPGGFMSEMTYQNGPLYYSGGGAYPHWWSYWLLDVAAPEATWTSSPVGFEGRVVEDGTVDGWAFDLDGWPAVAPNGPRQDLIPNAARHWSLYR